jgi:hypothetical protein
MLRLPAALGKEAAIGDQRKQYPSCSTPLYEHFLFLLDGIEDEYLQHIPCADGQSCFVSPCAVSRDVSSFAANEYGIDPTRADAIAFGPTIKAA